ncbi:fam-f protein [Plasmodium gallinaceum]|uniref:Fam-f protein n=1 Tax=Plasmodium gallinaceum TaxID=5849 RepID=A0A1J1GQN5_PLAGA|nr:fam-f protein [Plasmodium gallinaceum]CRG93599.1 fam-f protein [Plasmodium gallinaceum]
MKIIKIISICLYSINQYYNLKKYKLKYIKYPEIKLIRKLAELFDIKDEDIINDSGFSIKEVQLLHNLNDTRYEDTPVKGHFEDPRELIIKLIDMLFLDNYKKCMEKHKTYVNHTYRTLESLRKESLTFFQSSLANAKKHIKTIFMDHQINRDELYMYEGLDVVLQYDEVNTRVFINRMDAFKYLDKMRFNRELSFNVEEMLQYFAKLLEKNQKRLHNFGEKIYLIDKYISTHLGLRANRFPLKYTSGRHREVTVLNNYMDNSVKELHNKIFGDKKEKIIKSKTSFKVDVKYLSSFFQDSILILDFNINESVHTLFVKLNKILKGDIKCLITFISYIFEIERSRNKFILDNIKSKIDEKLFMNMFLYDIYDLYLQEEKDIINSRNIFKEFIKTTYGFDIDSSSIKSLVNKLYGSINSTEILELFDYIVKILLYKKQIEEYLNFTNFLKEVSEENMSKMKKFMRYVFKWGEGIAYIPKNSSHRVVSQFLQIYEKNHFFNNLYRINQPLKLSLKASKDLILRYTVLSDLLYFLNKELVRLRNSSYISEEEKKQNENTILFFMYTINKFNEQGILFQN